MMVRFGSNNPHIPYIRVNAIIMELEKDHPFVPYERDHYEAEEMLERSKAFYEWANTRRSVRDFSDKPVPKEVMEHLIMTGSTAPSGAHKQPWTFCLISNTELKSKLRELAEVEVIILHSDNLWFSLRLN